MFDPYMTGDFPSPGGWFVEGDATEILLATIDDGDYISPLKAFKLTQTEYGAIPIVKRIALPETVPYDVSLSSFAMTSEIAQLQVEDSAQELVSDASVGGSDTELNNVNVSLTATEPKSSTEETTLMTLSDPRVGCFYIYAFDGRLLAEYDVYGNCLKEYIYMGSRLVAEFNPSTSRYFYYTQDQIGSTRVVTDDAGAVVYAAAHDPYGGIQQTWANAFDPKRKFSDKERDEETGLDYFGARYFCSHNYRWLSVDPVLDRGRAIANSQLWNLYAFCANNPARFIDPDGRVIYIAKIYDSIRKIAGPAAERLSIKDGMLDVSKLTLQDLQDKGVLLLYVLATSDYAFSYSEANTILTAGGERPVDGYANLDDAYDFRYDFKGGKSAGDLPPEGLNSSVVVDPNCSWVDLATKSKSVSLAAIAFHELAEAYYKIQWRIQRTQRDGSTGAHSWAGYWERCLIIQRKDFTGFPGGGDLYRRY